MKKTNFNIKKAIPLIALFALPLWGCKKDSPPAPAPVDGGITPVVEDTGTGVGTGTGGAIITGTDPASASTQGFFLDSWQGKTFATPATQDVAKPTASASVTVTADLSQVITKASKLIFGNNVNPYMGQLVTEPALLSNLTTLSPNILRAPGGSLSDVYFWNAGDGQHPADVPDNLLDNQGLSSKAGYWYGNNTQTWTVTLDNYYKVLQQTNSTGLITVNYGYARYGTSAHPDQAAAHLAANWVRYDNGRTKYWEVGNESYGNWEAGYRIDQSKNQDGQPAVLTGNLYGTHFKVFADSMRKAALEVGATIKIGAVLSSANDANNSAGVSDWNAGVLGAAGNSPDFFVVHNYYTPYNQNSTADNILSTPTSVTAGMMQWVKSSASNAGVTQKPIALDEWNIQSVGSAQSVSNIAGLHAVMVLGEVLKNQISMASRWDLANGWASGDDQGMFNIGDEPGGVAKWNPRPAYYYMYFFQKYFGDKMVNSSSTNSTAIASYASTFTSGQAGVILVNKSGTDQIVSVKINNFAIGAKYYYYTLNGGTDNGSFSRKVYVNGAGPGNGISGGPDTFAGIAANSANVLGGIKVSVPAYGVVYLVADKK